MNERRNKVPVTVQIILQKGNKILLLRRYNTGYEDGKYCLPGGHVEKGEEIKQAAIREVKEEVGIEIQKQNLTVLQVLHRKVQNNAYIDFILICKEWKGKIRNNEEDKCDEIRWVEINHLPSNVLTHINEIFDKKNADKFYISYGWEE